MKTRERKREGKRECVCVEGCLCSCNLHAIYVHPPSRAFPWHKVNTSCHTHTVLYIAYWLAVSYQRLCLCISNTLTCDCNQLSLLLFPILVKYMVVLRCTCTCIAPVCGGPLLLYP